MALEMTFCTIKVYFYKKVWSASASVTAIDLALIVVDF